MKIYNVVKNKNNKKLLKTIYESRKQINKKTNCGGCSRKNKLNENG